MSRDTAYRKRMVEQHYTEQILICDGGDCGTITGVVPFGRPEGWVSVQRMIDGRPIAKDFCSWPCFHGWVMAEGEEDGTVLQEWTRAVEELRIDQLGDRPDIEREFAAVMNQGEQSREE